MMLKIIIAGNNHLQIPNSPRNSQHQIVYEKAYSLTYIPERIMQKVWQPLKGVSLFTPLSQKFDLIHTFNAIPYTKNPWIVTFESILPRTIGSYGSKISSLILDRLARENCRQIIAMSDYAKNRFLHQHRDWAKLPLILNKLKIIPPNFPLKTDIPKSYTSEKPLELIFVGNDFARKGGVVALRIARKAREKQLPLKVNIISKMNYGVKVYTDHFDALKYHQDLQLLSLPNVNLYQNLSNQEVIKLLWQSHFQVMCTLDDTYGFSILEGFSVGTPAITSNVCALPEFVQHDQNGFIVDLVLDRYRRWEGLAARKSDRYWEILDLTYEYLADRALEFIAKILDNPQVYRRLSQGAIEQAQQHDSEAVNLLFDRLYSELV